LKTETLIEKLETEKKKRFEFEIKQFRERAQQLEEELNENIDKGDNQYTQLKDEIKYQDETELSLSQNLNDLANRSNLLLRSKLNQNKSDFERLRHLGSSNGAIGSELE
jgi:predicted  nucleic acid-binding Zn-ribbon protein